MHVRPTHHRRRSAPTGALARVALAALAAAGCERDEEPSPGPPAQAVAGSGTAVQGTVGTALTAPLVVRVVDAAGRGVPSVPVRWQVEAGLDGRLAPGDAVTDARGEARTVWTLGRSAGVQRVIAVATTTGGPDSVAFVAQASAGAPAAVRLTAEAQAVAVGDTIALAASAADAFGNPAADPTVALLAGDSSIVRVEPGGVVRGRRAGTTLLLARAAGGAGDSVRVRSYEPLRATAIGAGLWFSCALLDEGDAGGGRAYCWGYDHGRGVGDQRGAWFPAPGLRFRALTVGARHACALTTTGEGWCWGANDAGQLGDGGTTPAAAPVRVAGGHRFASLSAGWNHSCGIDSAARVLCWGANGAGELGTGAPAPGRFAPTPVAPATIAATGGAPDSSLALTAVAVAAGYRHTCALAGPSPAGGAAPGAQAGRAFCWGARGAWLGLGAAAGAGDVVGAPRAVGGPARFTRLSAGWTRTCGIDTTMRVLCWGVGSDPAGAIPNAATPTRAFDDRPYADVSAGWLVTCAVATGGDAFCDGDRGHPHLLGAGASAPPAGGPARVLGGGYTAISVARSADQQTHACALAGGVARCWGWNAQGQVGLTGPDAPSVRCGFRDPCVPRPVAVEAPAPNAR